MQRARASQQLSLLFALATAAICTVPLHAQNEILYYKFDAGGGSNVVNYAPASTPAPEEGTITTNEASAFVPGRFASALKGGGGSFSTFVETGWNGAFSGDFSVAFFALQRNAPSSATYLFGNNMGLGFRAFTAGAAGRGLRVTSWGGTPTNLDLTKDLQTLVATAWVHVALVVDTSRGTATYYLDGQAEPPLQIGGGANVAASPGFRVGAQLTPSSTWDLDEFRFLNRAASPSEVMSWALRTTAADSPFGAGCGGVLSGTGGAPAVANQGYALAVSAGPSSPFVLALGASRTQYQGVPLPFDLGPVFPALQGCQWHVGVLVSFASGTDAAGNAMLPLPIPNDPTLAALQLYAQVLVARPFSEQTTNALAISIGF